MSILVQIVVGQFQLVEAHWLLHPVGAGGRGVGVDVEAPGHVWFRFSGDHPLWVVVLVATVVHGHNVNQEDVLRVGVQALQIHFQGGKHSPRQIKKTDYDKYRILNQQVYYDKYRYLI